MFVFSVCFYFVLTQLLSLDAVDATALHLVPRLEWLAKPPSQQLEILGTPISYVIVSHTASKRCAIQSTCTVFVRNIQTYHMANLQMHDIAYNFLVGGDGNAYEGRGWKHEGSHTKNYNSKSIGISFIGDFQSELPPEKQITAAQELIKIGVEKGYISENYKLLGACQVSKTLSPGAKLFDKIKTWPH